eukprot:scaffold8211_cov117-Cylindrotheca_fusiformis.AAC.2
MALPHLPGRMYHLAGLVEHPKHQRNNKKSGIHLNEARSPLNMPSQPCSDFVGLQKRKSFESHSAKQTFMKDCLHFHEQQCSSANTADNMQD